MQLDTNQFKKEVIGHPAGLFVLFFTEMWERFSYYGMRALLVLFLVSAAGLGGWEWTRAEALSLYGMYTGLVYITPIFGGLIADKKLGYRLAVVLGALLMTLGHASMAVETPTFFYIGLGLLIVGNGFFKPNISTIVGGLYKGHEDKKDGAYTIFYMGINAGAFLGILLCGYVGEKVGWSFGFGLAGIFMLLGLLQFWFAQKIFGDIGSKPEMKKDDIGSIYQSIKEFETDSIEIDTNEISKKIDAELPNLDEKDKRNLVDELKRRFKDKISRDRLFVIGVLAFFTIFFWMAFEQAGGSMTIFAKDYTQRVLTGSAANTFTILNAIISIVPLMLVTWVLLLLFKATFKRIPLSNLFLGTSFVIIWGVVLWMVNKQLKTQGYEAQFTHEKPMKVVDTIANASTFNYANYIQQNLSQASSIEKFDYERVEIEDEESQFFGKKVLIVTANYIQTVTEKTSIQDDVKFSVGDEIQIVDLDKKGNYKYLTNEKAAKVEQSIAAKIIDIKDKELKVPASWFGVLNSLFIILFAPLFSKIWESKYNPSAPMKFALGLGLLGLGFAALAYGASAIPKGAQTAQVSMMWLIFAYWLHTMGELALSPVGLSYVSKLSPKKLVGLMFGVWFTATAIANYLAGLTGSLIDDISGKYGLSGFFLIFTILPIGAALVLVLMNKTLVKKMHGIH